MKRLLALSYMRELKIDSITSEDAALKQLIESHRRLREENARRTVEWLKMGRFKRWVCRRLRLGPQ